MFERELEAFEKIIQKNTIGNAESIPLKSILESNIPNSIKSFFKSEIEWRLFQEPRLDAKTSKFNYLQDDVRILQEQIDLLLVHHYSFDQDEFLQTCDKSVRFLFNYLCRPIWTLENFLFDDKNSLLLDELRIKFRYCTDYIYYWSIAEKYFLSKNKYEITKEETIELLRKIDREIIRDNSSLEIGKMTEPFFHLIYYIQDHMGNGITRGIPTKALSYFFNDKNLPSVSEHIIKLRDKGISTLQYDELLTVLKDTFLKKGSYLEKESIAVPKPESNKVRSDSLMIPERERISIIAGLFQNNEQLYTTMVEDILTYQSWDEASLALDHFFTMNDIEPFSREAIMLINSLQSYFSGRRPE